MLVGGLLAAFRPCFTAPTFPTFVGLVVPAVTGIAPVLVPLAAFGLGLIMIGASVVHVRSGEVHSCFAVF